MGLRKRGTQEAAEADLVRMDECLCWLSLPLSCSLFLFLPLYLFISTYLSFSFCSHLSVCLYIKKQLFRVSLRFFFAGEGQIILLCWVSYPTNALKCAFFLCLFSYPCWIVEKGSLCFEFPMAAVSAGRGTRRLPPAATSNRLLITCYLC